MRHHNNNLSLSQWTHLQSPLSMITAKTIIPITPVIANKLKRGIITPHDITVVDTLLEHFTSEQLEDWFSMNALPVFRKMDTPPAFIMFQDMDLMDEATSHTLHNIVTRGIQDRAKERFYTDIAPPAGVTYGNYEESYDLININHKHIILQPGNAFGSLITQPTKLINSIANRVSKQYGFRYMCKINHGGLLGEYLKHPR